MLEEHKGEAQQALDELFDEHLLPLKLTARRVAFIGLEEYIVFFDDNRLLAVDISWCRGQCFKDVFRAAILDRMKRLNDPLHKRPTA